MMRLTIFSLITFLILLSSSCKSPQVYVFDPVTMEEEVLDTLVVTAPAIQNETTPQKPYRASATRTHDLIHTHLEISFDWKQQHVLGVAKLTLKPFFFTTNRLVLDAKTFDIHSVTMNDQELSYEYDGQKIYIELDKEYTKDESYDITIDYTGKPNEGPVGGSQAITSNKGLFFINPTSENQFKPQQIWTQGETENNSKWFPTIDKPNERCSQEIFITVEEKFKTLSNGLLVSSNSNKDGTRTDHWKQDLPHAPYLFMLGIGEYAVVKEMWNDRELLYYVEPEFEKDAKNIFGHTPEMLTFFSDILDYPYPWDKYAQIVCRDYVSGAMENTGAVVFGEFVQKSSRELVDSNNDDIVAHEMIHHWFGDLVTCESWSNLTLNEGFATYGEYLWQEYKYGHEAAERKRLDDLYGYLMSSEQGTHDLIDFEFSDKEDMFDGHSYNKGGLIVHMLRSYLGDDAFFASLNKYLTDNAYSDVEAHELRLAFENTCGEDLNWFFNQWFYDKGHPILEIEYNYDEVNNNYLIDVLQVQDPEYNVPVFKLPFKTKLYYEDGTIEYVDLMMDEVEEHFVIELEKGKKPAVVVLDGTHDILSIEKDERTDAEYVSLFKLSSEYQDKFQALRNLQGKAVSKELTEKALNDKSEDIRLIAVDGLYSTKDANKLKDLAKNDPSSIVRSRSLEKLNDKDLAAERIRVDESLFVIGKALDILDKQDPEKAILEAERLSKTYHKPLISQISEIFASSKDPKYLVYFEENIHRVGMFPFFNFMGHYGKLAKEASPAQMKSTADIMKKIALEENNTYYKKYTTTNLIRSMINELKVRRNTRPDNEIEQTLVSLSNSITQIANSTSDMQLRKAFSEYVETP